MFQKILKRMTNVVDPMMSHKVVQSDFKSREAHCKLMIELGRWKNNECGVKVVDVKTNDSRIQAL